jgi:hypothetical protein
VSEAKREGGRAGPSRPHSQRFFFDGQRIRHPEQEIQGISSLLHTIIRDFGFHHITFFFHFGLLIRSVRNSVFPFFSEFPKLEMGKVLLFLIDFSDMKRPEC